SLAAVLLRVCDVVSLLTNLRVLLQHDDEKPAEPDAFAASQMPDAVHPVVPVARADERQPVGAVLQRVIDRANRVLEHRCCLRRYRWQTVRFTLPRLERRRLEKR